MLSYEEAQELHQIIGNILSRSQDGGQYDTLGNYEPDLERALELAAIIVYDLEQ